VKHTYWLAVFVVLAGCSGVKDAGEADAGDDDGDDVGDVDAGAADADVDAPPPTFAVTGTVAGFAGSGLVLRLNGTIDLEITGNGAFSFPSSLSDGDSYEVTVAAEPTCPQRLCEVEDATGTISGDDAGGVAVSCAVPIYRLASNNWGAPQSIRITDDVLGLAHNATATPRVVTGASTGLGSGSTDSVAFDRTKNLVYAPAQNTVPDPAILVFTNASTITGDVAPARSILVEDSGDVGGMELDEEADRLYVSDVAGTLYIFDDASTLDGTVEPTAAIAVTAPGAITLDREADRLYIAAQEGSLYIFDDARELTSDSTPSRTVTWTSPTDFARSVAIDGCRDRLYLSIRNVSTGVNVFVFDDASALTGALDLHVAADATLSVPDNQVMSTVLDGFGNLYLWKDSATAVHIVNAPHLLTGAAAFTPDKTINAVVASGYGVDVMAYSP
jgi:hypothetical protein